MARSISRVDASSPQTMAAALSIRRRATAAPAWLARSRSAMDTFTETVSAFGTVAAWVHTA